ncbi:MAG: VPLPA-CTERM sorting domain-containing protein [Roseobacter sp.]
MTIRTSIAATAIALAVTSVGISAQAATLSGDFEVRVVNYTFNTNQSSSVALANQSNFDARFDNAVDGETRDTFTYSGELDFFVDNFPRDVDAESIADFFASNTNGSVSGLDSVVGNLQLSAPTFQTTTLFEFTEIYSNSFDTRVTHDDGFSIYNDDGSELVSFANPTGIRTTPTTGVLNFEGGEFTLVYAAANGNPSKLLVEGDGIPAVPLPAPALMLMAGLGAFAGLRRKKLRS